MKLEDIKDHLFIDSNGKYVVLHGLKFWIFKTDGTFVACRSDLKNVSAVLFLPDDRIFVDGGKNAYHVVSLKDGTELWNHPRPKPMEYTAMKLVASKDYCYVYTFYEWREMYYLVAVDLKRGELHVCQDFDREYTIQDIACDEDDNPCLLKAVYIDTDDGRVGSNRIALFSRPECTAPNWKHDWRYQGADLAFHFLGSTNLVITQHLVVHNLMTNDQYYLLENETEWIRPTCTLSDCWIDITGKYITLRYLGQNVVVDIKKRAVAAVYPGGFFKGCLIGKEYWMSVGSSVERVPFSG